MKFRSILHMTSIAAVLALVLAACGDDSGGGSEATPTPPSTPSINTPPGGGCATPGQTFSCTCDGRNACPRAP